MVKEFVAEAEVFVEDGNMSKIPEIIAHDYTTTQRQVKIGSCTCGLPAAQYTRYPPLHDYLDHYFYNTWSRNS